jgi:cell division protease FtsH
MTDNNKNTGNKKGGFNAYWIYAIIVVFLIAYSLFQIKPQTIEIDPDRFFVLAENGFVERIDLIKNEEKAEVFLKQDQIQAVIATDSVKFKSLKKSAENVATRTPDLEFSTPPIESFYDHLRVTKEKLVLEKGPKFDFPSYFDHFLDHYDASNVWWRRRWRRWKHLQHR